AERVGYGAAPGPDGQGPGPARWEVPGRIIRPAVDGGPVRLKALARLMRSSTGRRTANESDDDISRRPIARNPHPWTFSGGGGAGWVPGRCRPVRVPPGPPAYPRGHVTPSA